MKVYVVTGGLYDNAMVLGVYRSLDAAMTAYPPPPIPAGSTATLGGLPAPPGVRPGIWMPVGPGRWGNGLDWEQHVTIAEYDLEG